MDVSDYYLLQNRDWDPIYLSQLFSEEFYYDFTDLWNTGNMNDMDLVSAVEKVEKYSPIVEDISLDDEVLCPAVEQIEDE